jgi:putative membrane protein
MPAVRHVQGALGATLLVAASAAACGGDHKTVPAAANSSMGTATQAAPSSQDKMWLAAAHQADLAEIEAGELASSKGATAQIRSLGSMLVADHTRLDRQLIVTAKQLGVPLPTAPTTAQIETQHRLTAASSGRGFDVAFVRAMIPAHQAAIAAGATEATHGSSPQVVTLAKQAAPVLEHHLRMFQKAMP